MTILTRELASSKEEEKMSRNIESFQNVIIEVSVYTPTDKEHIYGNTLSAEDYLIQEMSMLEESGVFVDRIIEHEELIRDEDNEEEN